MQPKPVAKRFYRRYNVRNIRVSRKLKSTPTVFQCCSASEPTLIIVKGTPGGTIDYDELPTYPPGAVYAVQLHAYMDHDV
ncbi:hypothetical protein H257_18561 [Aphanomyces astaci]|uniref:Uncharacterized protein n=1 Tax=Aphanomyces astaci TaxID=112090 RepID=W4FAT9_APHAT|nr:hypothetical protein H257_18561 [Aphanomyces astaci]ETV64557.1 hypothetical protein H257_18561 [Aphanomyces astaci]|eukprot:XP_009845954.1 hypothetical protein H257_18561 [Aphanomyces astaci]